MKIKYIAAAIFCLIILNNLHSEIFWDGRFYEQIMLSFKEEDKNIQAAYLGFSMLDLKVDAQPTDMLRVRSEIEYALPHQKGSVILGSEDVEPIVVNTLSANIATGDFKFTLGRFLPAWGKGKIFRPLDIFIPQTFFLNMLSFRGLDGISAKYYMSGLSSIEFITIPSMDVRHIAPSIEISTNSSLLNEINHTVAAANIEIHLATFDNNLIILNDTSSGNNLLGFAFKGDAILGVWGEFYYSFNTKKKEDTFKASIGADYSFAKYFFMAVEYFYDESGMKDYKKYPLLMTYTPRMTFGEQYLMADFNIVTYMELNYGITYLGNLLDKSFVIFPYLSYEVIENCFLGLSLYHFNGKTRREFSPGLLGNYIFNTYLVVRF